MNPFSLLNRRVRGFLVVELVATTVLTLLVLTVYLAKTGAGDKRDDIDRVEQQIETETAQIAGKAPVKVAQAASTTAPGAVTPTSTRAVAVQAPSLQSAAYVVAPVQAPPAKGQR